MTTDQICDLLYSIIDLHLELYTILEQMEADHDRLNSAICDLCEAVMTDHYTPAAETAFADAIDRTSGHTHAWKDRKERFYDHYLGKFYAATISAQSLVMEEASNADK